MVWIGSNEISEEGLFMLKGNRFMNLKMLALGNNSIYHR